MEIFPTCCDKLKRCWRRKKYRRLNNFGAGYNNKRKLKVARLGGPRTRTSQVRKTNVAPNMGLSVVSPFRLLARFHDGYVAAMMKLAINVEKLNGKGMAKGKKVAKDRNITRVSVGEEVHDRLVLDIYKRMIASRDLGNI